MAESVPIREYSERVPSPAYPDVLEVSPKVPKRKRVFISQSDCDFITPVKKFSGDNKRRRWEADDADIDVICDESVLEIEKPADAVVHPGGSASEEDASDIDKYLRSLELKEKNRPIWNFIEVIQKNVTARNRMVLVDWLVEVASEYNLSSHTLYLAVSCLDRFLSRRSIPKSKLQLLGVACMSVAAKYEEMSPPNSAEFADITDNAFTKREVSDMEINVLKVLEWQIGVPTTKTFLSRLLLLLSIQIQNNGSGTQLEFLTDYLAELSLLDYSCIRYPPSMIAASAVFLARLNLQPDSDPWCAALGRCSNYSPSDLSDCVNSLHTLQINKKTSISTAIGEKYKQNKFKSVAMLVPPVICPSKYFDREC
ncbi:Cyclin A-like protein [Zostera marina]|uniref:Cyclin A-like protein n=1 Tax=Zostera marina TaxID=29655 RepID=A0A0K9PP11_ZOSMR|nr:Cyclin A-like protein [Zostera marina]